jgi:hypothetical protein
MLHPPYYSAQGGYSVSKRYSTNVISQKQCAGIHHHPFFKFNPIVNYYCLWYSFL